MGVVELKFPMCCSCSERATKKIAYYNMDTPGPAIFKHFCSAHAPSDNDDASELSLGDKIISGLTEAVAGDFARVTVAGKVWVPQSAVEAERERCAKIAESIAIPCNGHIQMDAPTIGDARLVIAAAIRGQ